MEKFEVTLKNPKLKRYHLSGWLLIFLNIAAQLIYTYKNPEKSEWLLFFLASGICLALFIIDRVDNFRNKKKYAGLAFLVLSFVWIRWHVYIAAGLTIILYFLYYYSSRKIEIYVQPGEITIPSFPKRTIQWNELQNIMLKDRILTIDFKNNKLLQHEIEENDSINEKDFNEFCKKQLNK